MASSNLPGRMSAAVNGGRLAGVACVAVASGADAGALAPAAVGGAAGAPKGVVGPMGQTPKGEASLSVAPKGLSSFAAPNGLSSEPAKGLGSFACFFVFFAFFSLFSRRRALPGSAGGPSPDSNPISCAGAEDIVGTGAWAWSCTGPWSK